MIFTSQQIKDAYKKLPEDLKDALFDVDSEKAIEDIGKKYGLLIDKVGEIAEITNGVTLGLVRPSDFVSSISQGAGVDRDTAIKIASDINAQVFAKIRESLKKIHQIRDDKELMGEVEPAVEVFAAPAMISMEEIKGAGEVGGLAQRDILDKTAILQEIEDVEKIAVQAKAGVEQRGPDVSRESVEKAVAEKVETPIAIAPFNPFEEKMKEGVFRMPMEEKKSDVSVSPAGYVKGRDPYREQV